MAEQARAGAGVGLKMEDDLILFFTGAARERKLGSMNPFFCLRVCRCRLLLDEKAPLPYAIPFFTRGSTTE